MEFRDAAREHGMLRFLASKDALLRRSLGRETLGNQGRRAGSWTGVLMACVALSALSGCKMWSKNASAEKLVASRRMSLQGTDALQRGHWEEAEAMFGAAVKQCAVDERARAGYAEALWQRGACDEAIRQLEQASRLAEGDQDLLVRLGEMRLARGDRDGAYACAQQALDRQRGCAAAWALQANVLRSQGKLDEALDCYHRALHCDSNSPDSQLAIAELYCQQNKPRRALATLEALADAYGPGKTPANVLAMQGIAQRQMGRYDEAVASLAAAARQGPADVNLLRELSHTQLMAGDAASARATTLEALRLHPEDAQLRQFLASLEKGAPRMAALNRESTAN